MRMLSPDIRSTGPYSAHRGLVIFQNSLASGLIPSPISTEYVPSVALHVKRQTSLLNRVATPAQVLMKNSSNSSPSVGAHLRGVCRDSQPTEGEPYPHNYSGRS